MATPNPTQTTVHLSTPSGDEIQVNQEAQSVDPSTSPNVSPHVAPSSGKTIQVTVTGGGVANIRFANPS